MAAFAFGGPVHVASGPADREAHVVFEDAGVPALGTPEDAVQRDPAASYARCETLPLVTDELEQAVIAAQLGRRSRAASAVAHRCTHGLPTVLRVDPRLRDGTPFPTTFWSTCPLLNRHVGTLESEQAMVELNQRLEDDQEFADAYDAAARRYVAFRDRLADPLPGSPRAGGAQGHVKCLHSHAGHTLATDDNVVGHEALDRVLPMPCPAPCVDLDTVMEQWGPDGSEVRR